MPRCPFNNFSKCAEECPFSADGMSRCTLAESVLAMAGAPARRGPEQTALPLEPARPVSARAFVELRGADRYVGMSSTEAYQEYLAAVARGDVMPETDGEPMSKRSHSRLVSRTHGMQVTTLKPAGIFVRRS